MAALRLKRLILPCTIWVLLLCSSALGQLVVLPTPGNLLGAATAPEPGKWIVFAEGFMPVQPTLTDGGKTILWQGKAGLYAVVYLPPGDGQPVVQQVKLGEKEPGPDPPDPPTPGGPYQLMMVYDADLLDNYPPQQRALLTSQTYRRQLVQTGHVVLEIVERAALDLPSQRYAAFFAVAKGKPLPLLLYAPKAGGDVKAVPLPANWQALQEVLK